MYAPGHGDLFQAVRRSGTLEAMRERGVRIVTISNVDNLGARVDPVVVGAHLAGGRPLTCEVARKEGDMGGAPVRVEGRLQLVEGPRFPPSFDQELAPVFNTNTALFDIDALDEDYDLTWLYVQKTVEGRDAVQLERLYHEVSALVPAQFLEVPRRGPRGRFLPIKTPADLERAEADLRELVSASIRHRSRHGRDRRGDTIARRRRCGAALPPVGMCACSTSSFRSGARSATRPVGRSARAAGAR